MSVCSTGPAPNVEHVTVDLASFDQAHEGGLGSADVPRRRTPLVGGVEIGYLRGLQGDTVDDPVLTPLAPFGVVGHDPLYTSVMVFRTR